MLTPLLALLLAVSAAQARQTRDSPRGIPVYGNWCGPGYGSGEPVDPLDACCQVHDGCYDSKGYFACQCDAEIVTCLQKVSVPDATDFQEQVTFKKAAVLYFSSAPCRAASGSVDWSWQRVWQRLFGR